MKRYGIVIMTIVVVSICRCSLSPHAQGGTTDTDNAKIAAVVYTPDGERAANATVTICPTGYHSGVDADSVAKRMLYVKHAVTDDTGYFGIDSIENGTWAIEVNDGSSNAVLLEVTLKAEADSGIKLDTTLRPYSSIIGNAGTIDDTTVMRYLVAYGLERRVPVASDGSFHLDNMPAGTFHCRVLSNQATVHPVEIENVQLLPDSTVTVAIGTPVDSNGIDSTMIVLNTTSSGADVSDDVCGFPALVRLTNENYDFTQSRSSADNIRFVDHNGMLLPFEIELWDSVRQSAAIWVLLDTVVGDNDEQSFIMLSGDSVAALKKSSGSVFDSGNGFLGSYHLCGSLENAAVNNYHGIDSGSVDTVSGIIGKARAFNGTSQYFSVDSLPDRERGTISCWFRPNGTVNSSLPKTQGIWGKKNEDSHNYMLSLQGGDFYAGTGSSGKLISKLENPDTGYYLSSTTPAFTTETWYYAVWVWGDGGDSLYVNGTLEATIPKSVSVSGEAIEEIGRSRYDSKNISGGGPLYFKGSIDEFRIDKTNRSSAWIKLCHMNQQAGDKLVTVKKSD